ncbi:hypothetical protein LEP1GSC188_0705 [Leptospira weilii serovar Topaz str. LT2116]|uniref:Uncharacterized protein n=1 Tax=Leptospira weilii serovar Topaz str. LT2116 TaxID=1088540 RepID=M3G762_9LEPT|nr:hypothetical protein LEP1GSC188_0705 [Leptospira weilii serovar Topaz str. LT2116]
MSITETVPRIALKDIVFRKKQELLTIFHTILERTKKSQPILGKLKTCRAELQCENSNLKRNQRTAHPVDFKVSF